MKIEGVPRSRLISIFTIGDDTGQAERLADLVIKENVKDTSEIPTARWIELLEMAKHS